MSEKNELQVILKEQDLEKSQANKLLEAFGAPFEEAGVVLSKHKDIKVTSEDDKQQMKEAREMRLILKNTRVKVEHARKDLKAGIIKEGRAIDSVARFVKDVIEPAEEYLQTQEDFVKIRQAEEAAQKKAERIEELSQYTDDVNQYRFETMTDEEFDQLIDRLDREKKALAEAEKAAEEKRIAAEKAEAERIEAQRIENEKLKAESAEREKKEAEERRIAQQKIDDANRKAAEEAAARRKLEDEQEAARKAEADQKAAEAEKQRQAELAPDKEKLIAFADQLESFAGDNLPSVDSDEGLILLEKVNTGLNEWADRIRKAAEQL